VAAAKETVEKIATEEKSLTETLSNIKEARSFEDLTVKSITIGMGSALTKIQVDEVSDARPEIRKAVEGLIKKGQYTVPGYRVSSSHLAGLSIPFDIRTAMF